MATSNAGLQEDASSALESHDSSTESHDPQLHSNKTVGLLKQVCKDLSDRTSRDVINTALETDTQETVRTQLIPTTFEPHGLTTPLSVIVGLLLHCFLLLEEIKSKESREDEREMTELREEVQTLKELYDGVVRINQQWALDYDKLQQQIDDAQLTGFVTPSSSRSHGDILMSPSSDRCFECYITKSRLQDSASEVERIKKECEAVKRELRQVKGQQEVLKKERDQAVSENRAIQFQLQELGDLRQAMHLKEEYPKRVQELKSVKRQLQEEVCTRIKLDKQIERLRRVFTDLFPVTPTKPDSGRGLSTYPPHLRPCHAHQQFYSDPGPPTPPGLIARGHLTSLVERDVQSLSQQSEEQVISYERPLVRLHSPTGHAQERWASDPHLNVERVVNGHSHSSLAPPTVVPVRTHSARSNRRPRSLFDERGDMARSLVDVRYPSDTTNQISPPEVRSEEIKCPNCGDRFHLSQVDTMFDHLKLCGT